jgi:glycosyltransferase involved in cell wall biosynthesis
MFLSIIIPLYNAEKYICRCIESCFRQGLNETDFEVIVVNDGSPDNSLQLADDVKERGNYKNVIIVDKLNEGVGATRNRGLGLARGEYVAFLDSDDYYLDNSLLPLLTLVRDYNLDILYFRTKMLAEWDDNWSKEDRGYQVEKNKILSGEEAFYEGFEPSSMCCCFFRRNIVKKHCIRFSSIKNGEDAEFCYQITAYAGRVMFVNEAPYIYFLHHHSELEQKARSNVQKIYDSFSVAQTLCSLSCDLKTQGRSRLSKFILLMSSRVRFGALHEFWKNRKTFQQSGQLKDILDHIEQKGYFPLKGPFPSWKHWLVANLILNRSFFYK